MKRFFTAHFSDTQVEAVFRAARFGDRTRCPRCGFARKLWRLSDGRWRCQRCRKRFGLLTDTWLSHTRFSLGEIYELLYWFELELTDYGIALLRPSIRNRRRAKREKLRKSGKVKRGRGAGALQQVVFGIYERTDGIVYVEPVPNASSAVLQSIIHDKVSIETTVYSDSKASGPTSRSVSSGTMGSVPITSSST